MAFRRRFGSISTLATAAILIAAVAVIGVANYNGHRRREEPRRGIGERRTAGGAASGMLSAHSSADFARRLQDLDAVLRSRPDDAGAATAFAELAARQARLTGDSGLALRAERALTRVLTEDPGNYEATRALTAIYLSQHRFRAAIETGEKMRGQRPYDAVTYGMLGDAHLELGEYDDAFAAFDRMMALRPSAAAYARVAYARELQGNLSGALEAMTLAEDATGADDPEGLSWTRAQLGDLYAQLGRPDDARRAYVRASEAFPGHPFAVIGYANVLSAQGDAEGALAALRELERRSPTPDVRARIGDVLVSLGRMKDAEIEFAAAEAGWRSDMPEPKVLVRFLVDHNRHVDEAVDIARRAASSRRDIFTEDALAWACFKAGRLSEARAAIALALRTGTRDRQILSHADAIRRADVRGVGRRQS